MFTLKAVFSSTTTAKSLRKMAAGVAVIASLAALASDADARSFWQQAGIDLGNAAQGVGHGLSCLVNNLCMKVNPKQPDGASGGGSMGNASNMGSAGSMADAAAGSYIVLSTDSSGCDVATNNSKTRAIKFTYGVYSVVIQPQQSVTLRSLDGNCVRSFSLITSSKYI